ncbi:MAG: phosphate signaling complex protein PhoU [Candidatus Omnitrophica bacterium]|nr:phosphate signaling complex protein PhoU [Candidatus Omnitrophota bacterium]
MMERHFDDELKKVREKLFRMGLLVEEAVSQSMAALFERDSEKAKAVIKADQDINLFEIELDELGHELMARYQPAARDLRLLTMALKITNDLERMGDQAVNIAEKALVINQEPPLKPYQDLPEMAEKVREMVRGSLSAFMDQDPDSAKKILEADDTVDEINDHIYDDVQAVLVKNPDRIRTGVSLIMVSHNLERIADLATNIAEDVIYLKKGVDVRHHIRERRGEK